MTSSTLCEQYEGHTALLFKDTSYEQLCKLMAEKEGVALFQVSKEINRRQRSGDDEFKQTLSPNEQQFLADNPDAVAVIPEGPYCYSISHIEDHNGKIHTVPCPHLDVDPNENTVACIATGLTGDRDELLLLLDGVKECGFLRDSPLEAVCD